MLLLGGHDEETVFVSDIFKPSNDVNSLFGTRKAAFM